MKNAWSIICEKSVIDAQSNLLSLFNCVEEVEIKIDKTKIVKNSKLIAPINLQLISLWMINNYVKENLFIIKIELVDPEGAILSEFSNTLKSQPGNKRLRSINNIQGMPVTKSGRYYFRISRQRGDKFDMVSELALDVNLILN